MICRFCGSPNGGQHGMCCKCAEEIKIKCYCGCGSDAVVIEKGYPLCRKCYSIHIEANRKAVAEAKRQMAVSEC